MSYDIRLCDPETRDTLCLDHPHAMRGGTFAMGGTSECWLNITYNYSEILHRVLGEKGIRGLYGKTGTESIPMLKQAIGSLKDDASGDYWEPTEGNVKKTLCDLLTFATARPDGVWDGD